MYIVCIVYIVYNSGFWDGFTDFSLKRHDRNNSSWRERGTEEQTELESIGSSRSQSRQTAARSVHRSVPSSSTWMGSRGFLQAARVEAAGTTYMELYLLCKQRDCSPDTGQLAHPHSKDPLFHFQTPSSPEISPLHGGQNLARPRLSAHRLFSLWGGSCATTVRPSLLIPIFFCTRWAAAFSIQ